MMDSEWYPLVVLGVGILTVLVGILVLRLNAFLALLTAAMLVSLMGPGELATKVSRVATAFGNTAGGVGIVIALAAIIGYAMMESGAADRIVRLFTGTFGPNRTGVSLMGSGFVLAVPVFFDTVFYLLVPLARSLYRRTGKDYLKALIAIAAGGAITHTLVPPTPGPMLIATQLNVDLGLMILVGMAVALPAAIVGLAYAAFAEKSFTIPVRTVEAEGSVEPVPEPFDVPANEPSLAREPNLPPLLWSLAPVLLPVLLISANTVMETLANAERAAQFRSLEEINLAALDEALGDAETLKTTPAGQLLGSLDEPDRQTLAATDDQRADDLLAILNDNLLVNREILPGLTRSQIAIVEHRNRLALEETYPEAFPTAHAWESPMRQASQYTAILGNPNLALLLAAAVALGTLAIQRKLGHKQLASGIESALMSGGVIILITCAGGAFGAMLTAANVGDAIERLVALGSGTDGSSEAMTGLVLIGLGFAVASLFKIAQGSSTVAMITASGIMAALLVDPDQLGFHPVYLATAIGSGSLMGSWMNDSGFWIFAKMGGLTEPEALKTWTVCLMLLSITGLAGSIVGAMVLPLNSL